MHPKEGEIEALHSSYRTGNICVYTPQERTGNRDVTFNKNNGKWEKLYSPERRGNGLYSPKRTGNRGGTFTKNDQEIREVIFSKMKGI